MLLAALTLPALAADSELWIGGAASGIVTVPILAPADVYNIDQAEFDLRYATGIFRLQLDIDVHIEPRGATNCFFAPGCLLAAPASPEAAYVQLGGETWDVSGGVVNPPIGIEAWDEWLNAQPILSAVFAAQPGRVLGAQAGWHFGDSGAAAFVYGGADLDWGGGYGFTAPTAGVAVSVETDAVGSWNGAWAYPTMGYYGGLLSGQFYVADPVWIDVSAIGGVITSSPFVIGFAGAEILPEGMFSPAVRVQGAWDPNGAMAVYGTNVGADVALAVKPLDFLKLNLSGGAWFLGGVDPSVSLSVSVFRPEDEAP